MDIVTTRCCSAQFLRPIYELYANQPDFLADLQLRYQLPSAENINQESERIPTDLVKTLLRYLSQEQGLQDIGLKLGSALPAGCFGSLSYLLMSSSTIRQMLDYFCQYFSIAVNNDRSPAWSQQGDEFILEIFPSQTEQDIQCVYIDFIAASAYCLIQHATPDNFQLTRMLMPGDTDESLQHYQDCFGVGQVEFKARAIQLCAPVKLLDTTLPNANPMLCRVFRKELDMLLRTLNDQQTIVDQIQQVLAQSDNLGKVSLGRVAEQLALGERSLTRQLAKYEISFRDLLTNYKSSRSIRLLAEGKTVEEVSYYLGFSERAAFDRAFKKWQGITPSRFVEDYRQSGAREMDLSDEEQLPTLPAVANQLLGLLDEGNYQMDEVADVVEKDPALTAKLLALANSAVYGIAVSDTIREAIVRVFGVDTLRNLAVAMLANQSIDTSSCKTFSLKIYWTNALATSQLAAQIAKKSGCAEPSSSYLLGLLYNIGLLLLVQRRPEDMAALFADDSVQQLTLQESCELERRLIGVDTCSAGALLAAFWNLPRYLSVSMRVMYDKSYQGEFAELVRLVSAVEYFVRVFRENEALCDNAVAELVKVSGLTEKQMEESVEQFKSTFDDIKTAAAGLL